MQIAAIGIYFPPTMFTLRRPWGLIAQTLLVPCGTTSTSKWRIPMQRTILSWRPQSRMGWATPSFIVLFSMQKILHQTLLSTRRWRLGSMIPKKMWYFSHHPSIWLYIFTHITSWFRQFRGPWPPAPYQGQHQFHHFLRRRQAHPDVYVNIILVSRCSPHTGGKGSITRWVHCDYIVII